ncbi:MAG: S-methyl-5-thioribose-1-phosphate isomerase [Deltaproteobacteria bacterium]|nr:MAG: S-methyl-5-thioribose-1-phosphate isomerase [Deltaproteobacteria bacterium]
MDKKRPVWFCEKSRSIEVIDQRKLPHKYEVFSIRNSEDTVYAIREMIVRGAPLIGVTAAWGFYISLLNSENTDNKTIESICREINLSRPTAINLFYSTKRLKDAVLKESSNQKRLEAAKKEALLIEQSEIDNCKKIGEFGLSVIENIYKAKKKTVNILTHCNAGWLACVEYGTATSPVYHAHEKEIPVHVWVDETRPLNQGARLTSWELLQAGVPHTVIPDNAGGHLMQHDMVDIVIVGSDRTTINGDVANKTGTYLKALAAKDNKIPFYAALPGSTIDWKTENGIQNIPIELRDENEVKYIEGLGVSGIERVLLTPSESKAVNYAFDVTPSRLVTGIITERGVCRAEKNEILKLFPENKP